MKKRALIISVSLLALLLIGAAGWIINGFFGNPVSALLAKYTAEKHIEENYGGDFALDSVSFNFKDGCYHAHVTSRSSEDSAFSIVIGINGKLYFDTYEDRVTRRGNTAFRLDEEYRRLVDGVLDGDAFTYDVHIGYGELSAVSRHDKENYGAADYAIITDDLTLDGVYDINELGARAGKVTLYIYDGDVSVDRLSEILLDVRDIFDGSGVRFYVIDCVLEYPKGENGEGRTGRVEVMEFLYTDIYAEGLLERVSASDAAAKEFYARQDADKLAQMK